MVVLLGLLCTRDLDYCLTLSHTVCTSLLQREKGIKFMELLGCGETQFMSLTVNPSLWESDRRESTRYLDTYL